MTHKHLDSPDQNPCSLKLASLKEVWVSFWGIKISAGYDSIPQTSFNIRTILNFFSWLKLVIHTIPWKLLETLTKCHVNLNKCADCHFQSYLNDDEII